MDLHLGFDDEDLQSNTKEKSSKTGDQYHPYNVKICSPKWFVSAYSKHSRNKQKDTIPDDDRSEQLQQILKFDADSLYRQRNYSEASQKYQRLLDILPASNVSVRLDAKESLSRCYTYLGLTDKGVELAHEIAEEISKEDESRHRQSISLLSFVYAKSEQWKECIQNQVRLCEMQLFFPQTWHELGDIYSRFNSTLAASDVPSHILRLVPVLQLTCYLRARFLLLSVMNNASHLVKNRNKDMITALSEKIEQIPLSESEKIFANQYLETEMESSSPCSKGDILELSEAGSHLLEEFYSKFCLWHIHYNNKR